ncbi:MAG: hypothetical protein HOH19_10490 [Kordiimonadaceae bacterium]|jgi:hypothetical protein|nr:hypothetical protein [Kordiimonadaceae bacterium]MBT6032994.1 hypothetical protein [Kordiimonadaceae bacterium]
MNKQNDIYSVDYYLSAGASLKGQKKVSPKRSANKKLKVLVRDDVKDSLYLVDA